jgi:cytochrome c2
MEPKQPTIDLRLGVFVPAALILVFLGAMVGVNSFQKRSQQVASAIAMTGGDPRRAPALLRQYGCSGCHTITGVAGADGKVGGSLGGLSERVYIAGVLNNTPDNLVGWIVTPPVYSPRTAMPVTGITPAEARDIAAYLYAH